jgi:fatty acid desaturase
VRAAVNNARFIIQISKGLIRDQRARRTLMFYNVLAVLVLIFMGATFLWSWLREHPLIFIGYWGLCAWLTVLAMLLALYDLAKVRLEAKRERRRLEEECLAHKETDSSHDSHPT